MPILGDAAPAGRPTYRILGPLLGGGPHTSLVVAHHDGFDRECVQKTIFAHPTGIAFTEPRLLDRIRGEDIVTVLDAQHDPATPGAVTFVMPRYPEGSVVDALNSGHQFSLREAIDIVADGLTGLMKVHTILRAIHGDIKPGNVLLRLGRTRGALSDFGSAMPMDLAGNAPTVGPTFIYLAPEVLSTTHVVNIGTDIYAFGLTLFEILNGALPYASLLPSDTVPRLQAGQRAVPDRMLTWQPHVPSELRRVVNRCISRDPARRPTDTRTMLVQLRALRPIDWRRVIVGPGIEGSWEGTWPPQLAVGHRRRYFVEVAPLRAGTVRVKVTRLSRPGAQAECSASSGRTSAWTRATRKRYP